MAAPTRDSSIKKKRPPTRAPTECKICGASALYSYFGIVSCIPCKMFFKRNADHGQTTLKCDYSGNCEIDVNNRHVCSYCRLMKCFQCGMETERMRASVPKRKKKDEVATTVSPNLTEAMSTALVRVNKPAQFPTLNLLRADQSSMSIEQWNLISNLLHCYDRYSGLAVGERFAQGQATLNELRLVYEANQDFVSLSPNDRSILLQNTFKYAGSVAINFVMCKVKLVDFSNYYEAVETISNANAVVTSRRFPVQFDPDVTVHKLLLAILSFSTIRYTVYTDTPAVNLCNIKEVLRIQDRYTELLWRYLLYKNNFKEAVRRFSRVLQCLLSIHELIVKIEEVQWFSSQTDSLVRKIEEDLVFSA